MSNQIAQQASDFKTWAKSFDDAPAAGGKTKGTYSKIGTITVPNKTIPVYMYGILILIATQAQTAGESGHPEIDVSSSDLGLFQERFSLPEFSFSDPVGTQSGGFFHSSRFISLPVDQPVNNLAVDLALSSISTMTADWDMQASIIFGNLPPGDIPDDYLEELLNNFTANARSLGRVNADSATTIGAADTDVTLTGISIPQKAIELLALTGTVLPNAPTTIEEVIPKITYESGDISDFAPQEYPACLAFTGALFGTLVGQGAPGEGRSYPIRFPLPGTAFTLGVKVQNVIALSNAPDVSHGIRFKPKINS